MAFLPFLSKKKPVAIERSRTVQADGTVTETTSFELPAQTRPVRMEAVSALDAALSGLGGEVLHAMDPSRLIPFPLGGPPVWSVGIVEVAGPTPYTLLVTYGLSDVVCPEEHLAGSSYELSLAVPTGTPLSPWADAFLRHQARYALSNGAPLRPNDCVPFRGVPMTYLPFQPQHHAMMPRSSLVGMLVTEDPVLPEVKTPHGPVSIRRLVGIDALELDRAETWSPKGFLEALRAVDPLRLTPIERPSFMEQPSFRDAVMSRADAEGSDVDAALFELTWERGDDSLTLHLPTGRAAQRLAWALEGRVLRGKTLVALSLRCPPVFFDPQAEAVDLIQQGLLVSPAVARSMHQALQQGVKSITLR
jgi:hypothetical protein